MAAVVIFAVLVDALVPIWLENGKRGCVVPWTRNPLQIEALQLEASMVGELKIAPFLIALVPLIISWRPPQGEISEPARSGPLLLDLKDSRGSGRRRSHPRTSNIDRTHLATSFPLRTAVERWMARNSKRRQKRSLAAKQGVPLYRRNLNQGLQTNNMAWSQTKEQRYGRDAGGNFQWPIEKQYQYIGRYPPSRDYVKAKSRRLSEFRPKGTFYQRFADPSVRTANSVPFGSGRTDWNQQGDTVQIYPQFEATNSDGGRALLCPCPDNSVVRAFRMAEGCVCPLNETMYGMGLPGPWRSKCRSRWSCKNRQATTFQKLGSSVLFSAPSHQWGNPRDRTLFVPSSRMKYSPPWNGRRRRRDDLSLNPINLARPQLQKVEVYPKYRSIQRPVVEQQSNERGYPVEWEASWNQARKTLKRQIVDNAKKRFSVAGRRREEDSASSTNLQVMVHLPIDHTSIEEGNDEDQKKLLNIVDGTFNISQYMKGKKKKKKNPKFVPKDRKKLSFHKRPPDFSTLESVEWAEKRCQKTKTGFNCPEAEQCVRNLCFNGGTCMKTPDDFDDGFACLCHAQWLGKRCDLSLQVYNSLFHDLTGKDRRRNLKGLQERNIRQERKETDSPNEEERKMLQEEENVPEYQNDTNETELADDDNTQSTDPVTSLSRLTELEKIKSHKGPSFWDNVSHFFKRTFKSNGSTAATLHWQIKFHFFIFSIYWFFQCIFKEFGI